MEAHVCKTLIFWNIFMNSCVIPYVILKYRRIVIDIVFRLTIILITEIRTAHFFNVFDYTTSLVIQFACK